MLTTEPYPMPKDFDTSTNRVRWSVQPDRAALLLHDMQRYFLDSFPPGMAPRTDLLRNAAAIRDACARREIPVFYTAQPGGMSQTERGLINDFWGPGMSLDTHQREIMPEVAPAVGDKIVIKWRYSAFQRTDLLHLLRFQGRDQLIVCGVYAHIGCLHTAVEAFSNDLQTFFVADAVADFSARDHQCALDFASRQCAFVLGTDTLLARLDATTPAPRANVVGQP